MPKPNEIENREQEKSSKCYARRHMSMAASTYHDYALTVSWQSKVFYSDDRRDAEDFHVSNKTVFTLRTWLEDHGWLVPLDKKSERKRSAATGRWLPIRYRVLSHDEWAALHPGKCRFVKSPATDFVDGDPKPPDVESTSGPDVDSTAGPDVKSTSGGHPPDVVSSLTGRSFFQSPDVVSTAKLCSYSRNGKPEKRAPVFDFHSKITPPKPNDEMTPREQIIEALKFVGKNGASTATLSEVIHGPTVKGTREYYRNRDAIVDYVKALRKQGYKIDLIGERPAQKYVLRK